MASERTSNAAMVMLIVALVAVVGIFVYFMAANRPQNAATQMPTPRFEPPKVSMPEPAKAPQ